MNRERIAWTVSLVLVGLLAVQVPGTLAQRDDDYAFVRTLVDIHRQVLGNYVEGVDENQLREGAIEGMLSELDPYSVYVPPAQQEAFDRMLEGSFKGVGIQLDQLPNGQVEVVAPIDGSPAFKAGVMAGDVILKVNGESIEGLRLPEVIKKVGGALGSEVTLTVRHLSGQIEDLTMTRQEVVVPTVKGYQRKPDNTWDWYIAENPRIAYLRITQFTPDTYDRVREILIGNEQGDIKGLLGEGMQGLVLDLRFNPGGRLDQAEQVIDLFLDSGVIVTTKGRSRPEQVKYAAAEGTLPKFPLIILVNEHSASASEIVAGSLMDNRRALVIGERTYGKGSVQEVVPLDKGGELKLTVAYYYLPSGRLVHRKKEATDWGVQPQIVVPMDLSAQTRALKERYEYEQFRRPMPKPTTDPSTQPTTQPLNDPQLQRAVDTMLALVVLQANQGGGGVVVEPKKLTVTQLPTTSPAAPATAPSTAPATQP